MNNETLNYEQIAGLYGKSKIWFQKTRHDLELKNIKFDVFKVPHTRTIYLYKEQVIEILSEYGYKTK